MRLRTSFGVIEEILVEGSRSEGYKGLGYIRIKRFPEELYKYDHPDREKYRKANTCPIIHLKRQNCGLLTEEDWKKEMSKQSLNLPSELKVGRRAFLDFARPSCSASNSNS